jgi:hypothetical protein
MSLVRRTAFVAALAAAAACGGSEPTGGALQLVLAGPDPARAIQLRVVGRVTTPLSAAGVRFFFDTLGVDTLMIMAVAQQGQTLPAASVGQLEVPDVRGVYQATLLQVVAPDYSQQNPAIYSLTIQTP